MGVSTSNFFDQSTQLFHREFLSWEKIFAKTLEQGNLPVADLRARRHLATLEVINQSKCGLQITRLHRFPLMKAKAVDGANPRLFMFDI